MRVLLATTVLLAVVASVAQATIVFPDLVVRAVSKPPASVQAGTGFDATASVANSGRARASRSQVRFFLTPAAGGAKVSLGERAVPALRPRKRAGGRVSLTVPATLKAGAYRLTACADAKGKVREASERNNCRTSPAQVAVVAPGPQPSPGTDTTPPNAPSISQRPDALTRAQNATFGFSAEPGATLLCRLDGDAYAACVSPHSYSGLAEASHAFAVKARDAAGNESLSTTVSWTIDRTAPPAPTITAKPADPSDKPTAAFTFTDAEPGVSFRCRLDAQSVAACTSPASYAGLGDGPHTFAVRAVDAAGNESDPGAHGWAVDVVTPDPEDVAPPVDSTVASSLGDTAAFLYSGANPVQSGVDPGTIAPRRVAVVRGRAINRAGDPLGGVEITALDHPELGRTETRTDGMYDFALNGGGTVTLEYSKTGFLPAQRTLRTPWQDFAYVDDVALVPVDSRVTDVATGAGAPVQVARGNAVTDAEGTRQATMIFDAGTTAEMELPDGSTQPLDTLQVRATEFTVGDSGPEAMPGALPPTSGYTYAAELSVDEALAAGATDVRFDKPVALYVENFLGFPVGGAVPTGYYDRETGKWVASENGRVVKIVSESGGLAEVDSDGDGTADNTGIDAAERGRLAGLYDAGQELWRVEITHFTPWDCNWPYGPPDDAVGPNGPGPHRRGGPPPGGGPDCDHGGSTIGCLSQTLGEGVELAGTSHRLKYSSARAPGRAADRTVVIPLSGSSVPASLRRIQLEITVAGQRITRTFAGAANQSFTFVWDGRDAYGRLLQGEQRVLARIGFVYGAVYYPQPADFLAAFARVTRSGSAGPKMIGRGGTEVFVWRDWDGLVGGWDATATGLGGWSLDSHHSYSPRAQTVYRGDGTRQGADDVGKVVTTVAGTGQNASTGDGGPAAEAQVAGPHDVAVGPDGSVYIAELNADRIRKVTPDGKISTVAGRGQCQSTACFSGDGGPATQAQLRFPHGLAVAADGTFYIADDINNRIRRVSPGGTISTIAGTGEDCTSACDGNGDGGLAAAARVTRPSSLALAPDGTLYFVEQFTNRVRAIGPDGIVTTVAGGGTDTDNGVPATTTRFAALTDVALGPDGSLYVTDWLRHKVRRVRPDGMIETVAGTGRPGNGIAGLFGGDGGPATEADLSEPYGVAVAPDGTLYVADEGNRRIRRVATDGIITTLAGSGGACANTATGAECFDNAPARQSTWALPGRIDVGPDGDVYVADRGSRVRKIAPALPGVTLGETVIASQGGDELYVFDAHGRHLKTLDALTGNLRERFTYDADGRLAASTDRDDRVTTIVRDGAGAPTAIVAPGGQRTELAVDASGHLSRIENPAAQAVGLATTAGGLLTSLTEPSGATHQFTYDADGYLTGDTGPAGAQTLARSQLPGGWSIELTSPTGRATKFSAQRLPSGDVARSVVEPGSVTTSSVEKLDGTTTTSYPSGDTIEVVEGPDPRFGMQAPILASVKSRTPGGKTTTVTGSRSVQLSDQRNLLSVVTQQDELRINGRLAKATYDAATRKLTSTSAGGRTSVKAFDAKGRMVQLEPGPGLTPASFTYTAQGRLHQITQGARTLTHAYDAGGRVVSTANAAGTTTYTYDAADRIATSTLPGGRLYRFGYDAGGRRTSVTLPSGAVHAFSYSASGDLTSFTPAGSPAYARSLTAEREPAAVTLPGGRAQIYARDGAGRLTGIGYDEAAISFTNDSVARVTGLGWTRTGGASQQTALGYDGNLVTSSTSTGAAPGAYAYDYDNELRLTGVQLDSEAKTTLGHDGDGLLTALGPFTFTRGGGAGRVSRISDGASDEDLTYDAMGRIASRTFAVDGTDVYSIALDYDAADRVTARHETRGAGPVKTTAYAYDAAGRLESVRVDGALTEAFTYNADGDRTSRRLPAGGTETAVYDARRQLDSRGAVDYTFGTDGFMTARGATPFVYGSRGELLSAGEVTYVYDGAGRRVSRTVGGVETEYLYGNPENSLQVTATRGPGGPTSYFYNEGGHVFAFERGGQRYLVATDQVGSATAIVNAAGTVVKAITYDSFGNLTSDSAPAFAYPFGFAGGIADETTGLVRFGMRDYDPEAGRWTARDPSLDSGLDGNLYAYVGNDPVNRADPAGLASVSFSAYQVVGGGLKLTFSREGFSWCGELGFGVGMTLEADLTTNRLDKDTIGVFAEAKASLLGLATARLKGEVTNPCGTGAGPADGDYDFKLKPEACLAFACTNFDNFKLKGNPENPVIPKFKPEIGVSAKAGVKGCSQILW